MGKAIDWAAVAAAIAKELDKWVDSKTIMLLISNLEHLILMVVAQIQTKELVVHNSLQPSLGWYLRSACMSHPIQMCFLSKSITISCLI